MRDFPQIIDYDKDQLAYALANALKERDEALAVIKALRVNAREDLAKLTRERDEARESVRMLWEIAEVGLDDLSDEQLERVDRSWGAAEK